MDKPHASASFTLSAEAVAAMRAGRKLEAIKLVREQHGLGLAEAKVLVEAYAAMPAAGDDALHAAGPVDLPLAAVVHLQQGRLIDAIKAIRDHSRCGLKEASAAAHAYVHAHPHLHAMLREQQAQRRRHVLAIVAAAIAGAVALVAWTVAL